MAEAVVFILRAVVLVLLWGFVLATVVAVRHDVFGIRGAKAGRTPAPGGAAGRAVAEPPTARPGHAPEGTPRRLVLLSGPLTGTSVPLSGLPITIGRAPDSTIVLTDDYVSSHHARLSPTRHGWLLEDLGSTNGTSVAGEPVQGSVTVAVGVTITIGQSTLELQA